MTSPQGVPGKAKSVVSSRHGVRVLYSQSIALDTVLPACEKELTKTVRCNIEGGETGGAFVTVVPSWVTSDRAAT
jgi:hypothetical protein